MTTAMTIDECDAKRTRLLAWYGLTFAVWAGAMAALFVFVIDPGMDMPVTHPPAPPAPVALTLVGLCLGGCIAFTVLLLRLLLLGRAVAADPALAEAAKDERTRANQSRAFFIAFWVVMVAAALAIPLEVTLGIVVTAKTYAFGLIWLGVSTALLAYVALERRDAA